MAWYRTGTVTVTTGSATVVGAGTDFVSNAVMGDGFRGPDGRTSEIARVVSATELTLAEGYAGPSAGGQPFAIQPTQSYLRDLAQSAATLLATFGAVRDGIGQGFIADGSPALPAIRFAADQDTGLRRAGADSLALVTGGIDRMVLDAQGIANFPTGFRASSPVPLGAGASPGAVSFEYPVTRLYIGDGTGFSFAFSARSGGVTTDRVIIDDSGNLLVGIPSAPRHTIAKGTVQGTPILDVFTSALFSAVQGAAPNASACAIGVSVNTTTGRSLNAAGTLNASGADYAEYMTKAAGCGTIAPGDVCGVDADGRLTRTWADAVSFVVKSTDPAYVGGDTWAASMAPRPEEPGAEPVAPAALPPAPEGQDELAAWRALADAYPAALAAWQADHAAWQAATAAYARDLPAWEAALEAERVKVDRIAFCGQVPVNVTGDFAVGDYLIAEPAGAEIAAVAIAEADITFEEYRRRLGKVWAVRDGRAWIDVQHG